MEIIYTPEKMKELALKLKDYMCYAFFYIFKWTKYN